MQVTLDNMETLIGKLTIAKFMLEVENARLIAELEALRVSEKHPVGEKP